MEKIGTKIKREIISEISCSKGRDGRRFDFLGKKSKMTSIHVANKYKKN